MIPGSPDFRERCDWSGYAKTNQAEYIRYHDEEWGRPVRDSKALWNKLILDGMQAGLSWATILFKRDDILAAFDGLDPEIVADYGDDKIESLLANPGIIRSRAKCTAAVNNARVYLEMVDNGEDFSDYLWSFTNGRQIVNSWTRCAEVPAISAESEAMARDLKKRGFKFVGPTICYAFMQAVGIVNDHETRCFAYEACIER